MITLAAPAALAPLVDLDWWDRPAAAGAGSRPAGPGPTRRRPGRQPARPRSAEHRGPASAPRPPKLLTYPHPAFPDSGAGLVGGGARGRPVVPAVRLRRDRRRPDRSPAAGARPVTGPGGGAVVIHPGASAPSRRWPAARFAEVARALAEQGERVVVTGSAGERPLAAAVAEAAGLPADSLLAGDLDLGRARRPGGRRPAGAVRGHRRRPPGQRVRDAVGGAVRPDVAGPLGTAAGGPHPVLWRGATGDPHASSPIPVCCRSRWWTSSPPAGASWFPPGNRPRASTRTPGPEPPR